MFLQKDFHCIGPVGVGYGAVVRAEMTILGLSYYQRAADSVGQVILEYRYPMVSCKDDPIVWVSCLPSRFSTDQKFCWLLMCTHRNPLRIPCVSRELFRVAERRKPRTRFGPYRLPDRTEFVCSLPSVVLHIGKEKNESIRARSSALLVQAGNEPLSRTWASADTSGKPGTLAVQVYLPAMSLVIQKV